MVTLNFKAQKIETLLNNLFLIESVVEKETYISKRYSRIKRKSVFKRFV